MKRFSISILLLFLISNISPYKFLSKPFFSSQKLQYLIISGKNLKKFLTDPNIYIIDTREMATIAKGYIPNSILIPSTMFAWLYAVVPENSKVIIITDKVNKDATIEAFIKLNKYELYGYCIYEDVIKASSFNIQQIEYDPNTFESTSKIIKYNNDNENIIDIREIKEYIETGVISMANLIPLSTFFNDYAKIPKNGNVYVFCKSGGRAVVGTSYAKRKGYTNKFIIMKGGMDQAIKEGIKTVPYN